MNTQRVSPGGIAYTVEGHGTPVVLIHGYPLDSSAWSEVAERIVDRCLVVNIDLAGFGASRWPADGDLSMERHADDVAGVMDAEGIERAVIIGLSMGGYVALAFAERFGNRVAGLGLVGAKTEADSAEGKAGRDAQAAQILDQGRSSVVAGLEGALFPHGGDPVQRARLRTMIEATSYETYVSALAGMRDRPDRGSVVSSLGVPVAVVAGEHDKLLPSEMARTIAASAADGTVTIVPGAGHLVSMEAPDAVADALGSLFAH